MTAPQRVYAFEVKLRLGFPRGRRRRTATREQHLFAVLLHDRIPARPTTASRADPAYAPRLRTSVRPARNISNATATIPDRNVTAPTSAVGTIRTR